MLYLSNLERNSFRTTGALKSHFFGFSVLTIKLAGAGLVCCLVIRGSAGGFHFDAGFQCCCFTNYGSPGVSHNTFFLSGPYLRFIVGLIFDLYVSYVDSLMGKKTFMRIKCFQPL